MFLDGATPHGIAKHLTGKGIPTPGGKAVWCATTIKSILTNEKMKGDALLQKSYTVDFLTKKKKINEGEVPQYYVENAHPAIIEPAVFELVRQEMLKRKAGENRHSGAGIFASRIKCGGCGSWYGSKVWHSTTKYRRVVYQCNHKFSGGEKCVTPHLTEADIKNAFISAVNIFFTGKEAVIADFTALKTDIFDTRERLNDIDSRITGKKSRALMMEKFLKSLAAQNGLLIEFDEEVWTAVLDYATVGKDGKIIFTFKNGAEVTR
jgi:hypothetical protein